MLQSGLYNLLAVAVLMESFRIEFESLVLGILLASSKIYSTFENPSGIHFPSTDAVLWAFTANEQKNKLITMYILFMVLIVILHNISTKYSIKYNKYCAIKPSFLLSYSFINVTRLASFGRDGPK